MTTTPIETATAGGAPEGLGAGQGAEDAGWETARADLVGAGIATSSGQFLAGLMAAGALHEVGRPERLVRFDFPGVDPAAVDEIFQLGAAAGFYAGRLAANPSFHRVELAKAREVLREASFNAMAGQVARSAATAARAVDGHPADGESGRGH